MCVGGRGFLVMMLMVSMTLVCRRVRGLFVGAVGVVCCWALAWMSVTVVSFFVGHRRSHVLSVCVSSEVGVSSCLVYRS